MFLVAVTLSVIGQMFVIYFPPLQKIFQTEALSARGIPSTTTISEIYQFVSNRIPLHILNSSFICRSSFPDSVDIERLRDQRDKEVHREAAAEASRQRPVLQQVRNGLCMTVTACRRGQRKQRSWRIISAIVNCRARRASCAVVRSRSFIIDGLTLLLATSPSARLCLHVRNFVTCALLSHTCTYTHTQIYIRRHSLGREQVRLSPATPILIAQWLRLFLSSSTVHLSESIFSVMHRAHVEERKGTPRWSQDARWVTRISWLDYIYISLLSPQWKKKIKKLQCICITTTRHTFRRR